MTMDSYREATEKQRLVIDYCAKHAVVPRKSDDPDLPEPWKGVSTEEIQKGVRDEFDGEMSKAWELGFGKISERGMTGLDTM